MSASEVSTQQSRGGDGSLPQLSLKEREALEQDITTTMADINAAQARLSELVGRLDRHGVWAEHECSGPAHWLSWRCGMTDHEAREHVRVASALQELPQTRDEFATGRLSFRQVAGIASVASAETEADLLYVSRYTTGAQFARTVRLYRRYLPQDDDRAHRMRRLTTFFEPDGMFRISGRLGPDEGAVVNRALDQAQDRLREENKRATSEREDEDEILPEPSETSRADALVALAHKGLIGDLPSDVSSNYEVVVHVDLDTLRGNNPDGRCEVAPGISIPPEIAAMVACDAGIVPMFEREGTPLSVGRKTRRLPRRIRRAVEARDGTCRYPGCAATRLLHGHHVVYWTEDGLTGVTNIVLLCGLHHRLVHRRRVSMEFDGKVVVFRRPDGQVIADPPEPLRAGAPGISARNAAAGVRIDHDTCRPEYAGDPAGNYVADVLLSSHFHTGVGADLRADGGADPPRSGPDP